MQSPYIDYIGKMKVLNSDPTDELKPYIESYVFFENTHITNDKNLKVVSNGKVEMFIYYNNSNIIMVNGKKEIKLTNFIVGIFELKKAIHIKPIAKSECLSGVIVTFNFRGVSQFLGLPVKYFTNKVVCLEAVFGESIIPLIDKISKSGCNQQRETILNFFFLNELKHVRKITNGI